MFSERVHYALQQKDWTGYDIFQMNRGQRASDEAPAEYAAVSSQEEPTPYPVAEAPLVTPTTADEEQSNDPPAIVPAPRQRRATDAPMIVPDLQCPMCCLICGWPNLIELQRDVCPLCSSPDCLIPTSCELSVRCQRSGRDSDNVRIYMPSVRDSVDRRLANIFLRNSKS